MKQTWKNIICRVVLTVSLSAAVSVTAFADDNTFVQGTTVNGLGVSGMTVDEAAAHIKAFYSNEYQLTIKERNGVKETIRGADIGFEIGFPDGFLQQILDQQNAGGRASGPDVDSRFRVELTNTYSTELLDQKIGSLHCISGTDLTTTADAHVSAYQEGHPFEIVKEVYGTNVDHEKTAEVIRNAVASGMTEVDLEAAGCYYAVQVTSTDENLKNLCDTMNRCRQMTITYVFGQADEAAAQNAEGEQNGSDQSAEGQETWPMQEVLDSATICSWLMGTQDGEIQVNRDLAAAYVKALADKYDTAGTDRTFHTADGREVTVNGPYGWKINQAAETDALIGMIRTGQSQSREPAYASAAVTRLAPEWGNTYVEVDLGSQHVYMVKEGQVAWDAPCVTGNVSKGYTTPPGIYGLAYKERDRVLRGKKLPDGSYEYESPVSYWMPFNGGIGFHDANWRGSFGGQIFKTSGSHGCVNLPPSKVPALYELVYKGIPVICYN